MKTAVTAHRKFTVLAALVVGFAVGCSKTNTVAGPLPTPTPTPVPQTPAPGFADISGTWYVTWVPAGWDLPNQPPPPDQQSGGLPAFITQAGPNFSARIPDVGFLTGVLSPIASNHSAIRWSIALDAPCVGTATGISGTSAPRGDAMEFDLSTGGWTCPSFVPSAPLIVALKRTRY